MYQSSWISVVGVALELLGLFFLFKDLLKSKTDAGSSAEFQQLLNDLDVHARELVLRTHSGFRTLVDFMRGYLSTLLIEAEEVAEPSDLKEVRAKDPGRATIIEFIQEKGPLALRRQEVEMFVSATKSVFSQADIEKALTLNETARKALKQEYEKQLKEAERLRRIAMLGIFFVSIGALAQFIDLFV